MRLIVLDRWGRGRGDITAPSKAVVKRQVGGSGFSDTLEVTCDLGLQKGDRIVLNDGEWREYIVDSPQDYRDTSSYVSTPHASNSVVTLDSSNVIDYLHETEVSPRRLLDICTAGTEWYPDGNAPAKTPLEFELNGVGGYTALLDGAEKFGLEVYTRVVPDSTMTGGMTHYVGLREPTGRQTGLRFEYGRDLTDVRRTYASRDVATRVYVYGAQTEVENEDGTTTRKKLDIGPVNLGKPYLDADNLEQWGYPGRDGSIRQSVVIIDHSEIETVAELFDQAQRDLVEYSRPSITYEATIAAFSKAGLYAEGLEAGDRVQIVDSSFNPPLRLDARVTVLERDLLDESRSVVTLGDVVESSAMQQWQARQTARTVAVGKPVWDSTSKVASDASVSASGASSAVAGMVPKVDAATAAAQSAASTATEAKNAVAGVKATADANKTVVDVLGTVVDVTVKASVFASALSTVVEVEGLPARMVASPPPVRAQLDVWAACRPLIVDHDDDDSIPVGSIRVEVTAKPSADLVVRLTALKPPVVKEEP